MTNAIQTVSSLVKYSTPMLVSTSTKPGVKELKDKKEGKAIPPETLMKDPSIRTEDLLNIIIPPKEQQLENGQKWIATVLSTPATKNEVVLLQKELYERLEQKQARETGICPIREDLYSQCFDELIRQITIDCKQRGLLLVQVRNEIRNQLDAQKRLYESSIAYGTRKMLDSEQKKTEMQKKIIELEIKTNELQKNVEDIEKKIIETRKNETEKLEKENKEHLDAMNEIKDQNKKNRDELEKILSGRRD